MSFVKNYIIIDKNSDGILQMEIDSSEQLICLCNQLIAKLNTDEINSSIGFTKRKSIVPIEFYKNNVFLSAIYKILPHNLFCFFDKDIYDENILGVVENIADIMIENDFNVKLKPYDFYDFAVELHYSKSKSNDPEHSSEPDKCVESIFSIHNDNDGSLRGNVITCIIYFDVNCDGGELAIYSNNGLFGSDTNIKYKISPKSLNPGVKKIVIFDGEIYHNPLKYTNGHRNLLVIFLKTQS